MAIPLTIIFSMVTDKNQLSFESVNPRNNVPEDWHRMTKLIQPEGLWKVLRPIWPLSDYVKTTILSAEPQNKNAWPSYADAHNAGCGATTRSRNLSQMRRTRKTFIILIYFPFTA